MKERRGDERGVSAVLGTVLMLALMMTLVPGALLLRAAISDEMDAQREAAQQAAWCARNPDADAPGCPERTPFAHHDCHALEGGAWLCLPRGTAPPTVPPSAPAAPPGPPVAPSPTPSGLLP